MLPSTLKPDHGCGNCSTVLCWPGEFEVNEIASCRRLPRRAPRSRWDCFNISWRVIKRASRYPKVLLNYPWSRTQYSVPGPQSKLAIFLSISCFIAPSNLPNFLHIHPRRPELICRLKDDEHISLQANELMRGARLNLDKESASDVRIAATDMQHMLQGLPRRPITGRCAPRPLTPRGKDLIKRFFDKLPWTGFLGSKPFLTL